MFRENGIRIVIPLDPVTKKNSQQIIQVKGRPVIIPSKRYKAYEKNCMEYIQEKQNIEYPINLECHFYMATHRRVDLVNLLQAISDILVKAEVLKDDNSDIIVSYDGSRVHYDKEFPRTVIKITEVKDDRKRDIQKSKTKV